MEDLKTNIKLWLNKVHYKTLPRWVNTELFLNDLSECIIDQIKKSGKDQENIQVELGTLFPIVSMQVIIKRENIPSESLIYEIPTELLEVANSIRRPYIIERIDISKCSY